MPRDQLNVSRVVKGNRAGELSRVVQHNRGRNYLSPWKVGRKPQKKSRKTNRQLNSAYRGHAMPFQSQEKTAAAYVQGCILGVAASDHPLESKILALDKLAHEYGEIALPELAKQAACWLVEQERNFPGFVKAALAMEKQAVEGEAAPPPPEFTPEQIAAGVQLTSRGGELGKQMGGWGKAYSFLRKHQWILPLALTLLGGGLGGGAGAIAGGLGGLLGQKYLPQMAAWGLRKFGPAGFGEAFTQEQAARHLETTDPQAAFRKAIGQRYAAGIVRQPLQTLGTMLPKTKPYTQAIQNVPARAVAAAQAGRQQAGQWLGTAAKFYGIPTTMKGLGRKLRPTGGAPAAPTAGVTGR